MQMQEAIRAVFMGLGGWEAMMVWARENPTAFYGQVVPKLLPGEINNRGPHHVEVIITPAGSAGATVRMQHGVGKEEQGSCHDVVEQEVCRDVHEQER